MFRQLKFTIVILAALAGAVAIAARSEEEALPGWATNTRKKSIELDELRAGGPGKDGIPAIHEPVFIEIKAAREWLGAREPVISLEVGGVARAYPLQILMWHEIVNDRIGGVPVAVTFCPLCYSALVFDRRVEGEVLSFGVSGFLRHSDLVMYDRRTESLWQQFTGEAIVGDYTGTALRRLPAQIIAFDQFAAAYPGGQVLSRNTGYKRSYGRNPYAGYDDIDSRPWAFRGEIDDRLPPMEKVVAVTIGEQSRGYPYAITRQQKVINDRLGGRHIVVFHVPGAVSALDAPRIADSDEVGSTGVFLRKQGDRTLAFRSEEDRIVDRQTGSAWDITGKATAGPLAGQRLKPVEHGDYFAFAWLTFRPDATVYGAEQHREDD